LKIIKNQLFRALLYCSLRCISSVQPVFGHSLCSGAMYNKVIVNSHMCIYKDRQISGNSRVKADQGPPANQTFPVSNNTYIPSYQEETSC